MLFLNLVILNLKKMKNKRTKELKTKNKIEKRKKKNIEKLNSNIRDLEPANCYFFSDTKRTENLYINGLYKEYFNIGKRITYVDRNHIVIDTCKKYNDNIKSYGKVYLLIDKDDFDDFPKILKDIKNEKNYINGRPIELIWFNPCFEIWLIAHFQKPNYCLNYDCCKKKLNRILSNRLNEKFEYDKVDENIIEYFIKKENIGSAIKNFIKIMNIEKNIKLMNDKRYDKINPGTNMYEFVQKIILKL